MTHLPIIAALPSKQEFFSVSFLVPGSALFPEVSPSVSRFYIWAFHMKSSCLRLSPPLHLHPKLAQEFFNGGDGVLLCRWHLKGLETFSVIALDKEATPASRGERPGTLLHIPQDTAPPPTQTSVVLGMRSVSSSLCEHGGSRFILEGSLSSSGCACSSRS